MKQYRNDIRKAKTVKNSNEKRDKKNKKRKNLCLCENQFIDKGATSARTYIHSQACTKHTCIRTCTYIYFYLCIYMHKFMNAHKLTEMNTYTKIC